jgi:hypothetical protein
MADGIGSWEDIFGTEKQRQSLRDRDARYSKQLEQRTGRQQDEVTDSWEITTPKDVQNVGVEMQTAPTSNPKRPRALTIAYNPNTSTLVIVFRDNTWWQYNGVNPSIWEELKSAPSTGKYLQGGLDSWADMGPADQNALSDSVAAQISSVAQSASRMQAVEPEMSAEEFRGKSAKEFFKDHL